MDVENRLFPSAYILNKDDTFLTSGKNITETFFFHQWFAKDIHNIFFNLTYLDQATDEMGYTL